MTGAGASWLRKLSFWYVSIIMAGSLILFSVHLARGGNIADFGDVIQKNVLQFSQGITHSLQAVGHTVSRAPKLALNAVNVSAFIRPADHVAAVPVITAAPIAVAAKIPAPTVKPAAPAKPAHSVSVAAATLPLPAGNAYAWGNCTWWAAARRMQIHDPIPSFWGNAANWAAQAIRDGYAVDHHPSPGAIMQTPYSAGGLGHVAFVESVDPDGTWHISEMNVIGLNIVDHQTEPAAAAAHYSFIHDRL